MQKTCANGWCKALFEITKDDLAFYDKVSPIFGGKKFAIPPPKLCPECRQQRRLANVNDRHLYRRTSSKTGNEIIASISPDKPYLVYEPKEWWGDGWDAMTYGREFRFDVPIFDQLQELLRAVPVMSIMVDSNENSEYVQYSGWDKNCYLCYCTDYSEDCFHVHSTYYSKNTVDCFFVYTVELCYECVNCKDSYHLLFSQNCAHCSDSAFLFDCNNCKHCFGSTGQRNQEYVFFNTQLTKSEYEEKMKPYASLTHTAIADVKMKMNPLLLAHPRKPCIGLNNERVTGDYLNNCKNATICYDCVDLEDCKNCNGVRGAKDCYDITHWGHPGELCYECWGVGEGALQVIFSNCCWPNCTNLIYCSHCMGCQHCFGCAGLRQKKYCIFNEQYTKEDYEKLMLKIMTCVASSGVWGEYLPTNLSFFAYNESMANDYFPLTRETALERGFVWSDVEIPAPKADRVIKAADLPASIEDVPDDILNWAIACEVTKKPFKIIKQELEFYRNMKLPIPRRHPEQRHLDRMKLRNPRKLWNRTCAKCQKPISTSYSPERPEVVYCEECYLKEVY